MQCPRYTPSSLQEILRRSVDTKFGYLTLSRLGVSLNHRLHMSTRQFRPYSPSTTQHSCAQIEIDSPNGRVQRGGTKRSSSSTRDELLPLNGSNSKKGNFQNIERGHRPGNPMNVEISGLDIPTSTLMKRSLPFLDKLDEEFTNDTNQLSGAPGISSRPGKPSRPTDKNSSRDHRLRNLSVPSTKEVQTSKNPPESWQVQKKSLLKKFGPSGWSPRKRLSPDALEGIRALHSQYPEKYTTPVLAELFKVSPEAVRRIIRSKWRANEEEEDARRKRWDRRGEAIWSQMVEIGIKPPKKWRSMGVGKNNKGSVASNETSRFSELKHRFGDISNDRKVQAVSQNGHQAIQGISLSDRIL